jgi:hypothetical protein
MPAWLAYIGTIQRAVGMLKKLILVLVVPKTFAAGSERFAASLVDSSQQAVDKTTAWPNTYSNADGLSNAIGFTLSNGEMSSPYRGNDNEEKSKVRKEHGGISQKC